MSPSPQTRVSHDEFKRRVKITFMASTGRETPRGFHRWLESRLDVSESTVTSWFAPPEKSSTSRSVPGYAVKFIDMIRTQLDPADIQRAEEHLEAHESN